MEPWCRSDITPQRLEGLIRRGLLCPLTAAEEWRLRGDEDEHWLYIKDDVATPLPMFSRRIIEEVPGSWKWGVPDKDKKKIKDHLAALQILKERGMKG